MLPLDSASSNHSDHSAYTQSERDGRCARLPRGMPVGQRVHLHFPGTMATMATMAAMAWVSYISMAFLSSFYSQFLSSVPREIITVYYGPMPQDLRRLARFPDVFSSIFVNLSAKRSHCTYQGTLGYIWARFKEKTQNCPVLKCSLVATGPSRTRRCNRDTFHSGSPSYWRSMRAIDDKWTDKRFISTSSFWVKLLGIPKPSRVSTRSQVGRARLTRMLQVTCKARTNCLHRIMGQSWSVIENTLQLWTVKKLRSGTHYVTLPYNA